MWCSSATEWRVLARISARAHSYTRARTTQLKRLPFLAMKTLSKEQHLCSPTSLPSPFHALQDEGQRAWRAAAAAWKALRIRTPASCSNAFHPPSSVAPCDVRLSATARTHGRHTDSSSQTACGGRSTALRQRARAVTVRLRLLIGYTCAHAHPPRWRAAHAGNLWCALPAREGASCAPCCGGCCASKIVTFLCHSTDIIIITISGVGAVPTAVRRSRAWRCAARNILLPRPQSFCHPHPPTITILALRAHCVLPL